LNSRLKCLLLDDELPGLTYLKMLCEQLPELEVVRAYNSPEALLRDAASLEFDLCILDIEMPAMSGLQVANLLRGKPVIFATAYKEYAAEAFDLDAIDFVRKPLTRERLQLAVDRVRRRVPSQENQHPYVQLNTDKGKAVLHFDRLAYIITADTDSRDKIAWLHNGSSVTLKNISFDKLLQLLPPQEFARINKKVIIALKVISVFSFDEITTHIPTSTGKPLSFTLSEVYRPEFVRRFAK